MSTPIPTLFELKGRARHLQTQLSCKLHVTQNMVAKAQGFADWKALTTWYARRRCDAEPPVALAMTAELLKYLDQVESEADRALFQQSLILAYDAKDGQSFELGDDFEWCNGTGEQLCYRSVLCSYQHARKGAALGVDEVVDVLEDIAFFRYQVATPELTFEQVYEIAMKRCFVHPLYLWLNGTFFDLVAIPEIKVKGLLVRRNAMG